MEKLRRREKEKERREARSRKHKRKKNKRPTRETTPRNELMAAPSSDGCDDIYQCDFCNLVIPSFLQVEEHYGGRNHARNLARYLSKHMTEDCSKELTRQPTGNDNPSDNRASCNPWRSCRVLYFPDLPVYPDLPGMLPRWLLFNRCKLCRVQLPSKVRSIQHYLGEYPHMRMLIREFERVYGRRTRQSLSNRRSLQSVRLGQGSTQKKSKETGQIAYEPTPNSTVMSSQNATNTQEFFCALCDVTLYGQQSMDDHCATDEHVAANLRQEREIAHYVV